MQPTRTIRFSSCAALLVSAAFLAGCETTPKIRSDYDKSADFSHYRTYNFVSQPSTDKLGYSSLVTEQLKTAVGEEMRKRGYEMSAKPDLLVNFSGKLQKMQNVESTPTMAGGYYGYRSGIYGAWPGYANDVYTVNYTEGTLNIDLVDASHMRMVWEGVGVGEVTDTAMKDRQATISKAVTAIFAKYPFHAGSGAATAKSDSQ